MKRRLLIILNSLKMVKLLIEKELLLGINYQLQTSWGIRMQLMASMSLLVTASSLDSKIQVAGPTKIVSDKILVESSTMEAWSLILVQSVRQSRC
jgi:hypothetical protein